MSVKCPITKEIAMSYLTYEPESGHFYWKREPSYKKNGAKVGDRAGGPYKGGRSSTLRYWRLTVEKYTMSAHRLAWLFVYGEWPKGDIDHIDGNGLNNSIENLRAVSRSENLRNAKKRTDSTTGVTGVSLVKRLKSKPYRAHITVNGKMIALGYFATLAEASEARKKANEEYGFTERHGCIQQ